MHQVLLPIKVDQKGTKEAGKDVVGAEYEQFFGKLKCTGKLAHQLCYPVKPLHEHGRALALLCSRAMTTPLQKLVAKGAPILLDQRREATNGAKMRVQ